MNRLRVGATAVLLLAPAACGGAGSSPEEAGDTTLTVLAASSLTATFTELARDFEDAHKGVEVVVSFGGSSDLVAQVQQGAPADVVATADTVTMRRLTDEDLVEAPVTFATNRLQIAVPPGNPADVRSLEDLTTAGLNLVVCAPEVPCGAAAARIARSAGITLQPVSEEQSVTDVLGKVVSGEADAGLVYLTDVRAAGGEVEGVAFPESSTAVNSYPVAVVAGSPQEHLAERFVSLVTGDRGRAVLDAAGFGPARR